MLIARREIEYPMLMCGPMVVATIEERKTVTRRLDQRWLRVKKGQHIWIRETCIHFLTAVLSPSNRGNYSADGEPIRDAKGRRVAWWYCKRVCPSIHMPRRVCRVLLRATEDARLEELVNITAAECKAEGIVIEDEDWDLFYQDEGYDDDAWECPTCGGEGSVEYMNHPEVWGEDCPSLANHLVACPGCPENKRRKDEAIHRWKFRDLWDSLGRKEGQRWVDNPDVVRVPYTIEEIAK